MKLEVEFAGESHQVSFRRDEGQVACEVDGRRYEAAVREVAEGVYLLISEGRVYECRVEPGGAEPSSTVVTLGEEAYPMTVVDPRRLRGGHGAGAQAGDGTAHILAPMPGKIVRVLVVVGAEVEAGEGIVVVEAMKMQNEMKAPRAGTVAELRVEAGATVNAGDVLAVIE